VLLSILPLCLLIHELPLAFDVIIYTTSFPDMLWNRVDYFVPEEKVRRIGLDRLRALLLLVHES